jgi:hypothetical protein
MPLAEVVELLLQQGAPNIFDSWPVSDPLHMFKNLRQRFRNHAIGNLDGDVVDAADLLRGFGGLIPSVATPGQQGRRTMPWRRVSSEQRWYSTVLN